MAKVQSTLGMGIWIRVSNTRIQVSTNSISDANSRWRLIANYCIDCRLDPELAVSTGFASSWYHTSRHFLNNLY